MIQVIMIIDTDGNVRVQDVEGAGKSCEEVTADVEKALGLVDESSRTQTDNYVKPVEGTIKIEH